MDTDQPSAADAATTVAQTDSLLCRGLAIRRFGYNVRPADCQSAKQQVTNLRYSGAHGVTRPTFTYRCFSQQPGELCQC